MAIWDEYQCIFHAKHDLTKHKPVAIFDRYQFLMDFIRNSPAAFREDDEANDILTVRQWLEIYRPDGRE